MKANWTNGNSAGFVLRMQKQRVLKSNRPEGKLPLLGNSCPMTIGYLHRVPYSLTVDHHHKHTD